ncbi:MAG TPA: hypothetical protein VGD45_33020 [Steroidobacter sp.]|uniref:hypothetical protein n=1 Tax=Steroidobacter sp. TaxID=1978227 RepID=UPI002EDA8AC0
MTPVTIQPLPPWRRTTIIQERVRYVSIIALCLLAHGALAQQQTDSKPERKADDLDVTMQIIVDPDAKLPDEVVRRISLPERKSAAPSAAAEPANEPAQPDNERAREAKELGREVGQSAKERAKEAAEQREQARRAEAEDRRRDNPDRPDRPDRPDPPRPPRN